MNSGLNKHVSPNSSSFPPTEIAQLNKPGCLLRQSYSS